MPVTHSALQFEGERVGLVISLGDRYVFYTDRRCLAALDGAIFGSVRAIEDAVREQMTPQRPAARPRLASTSARAAAGPRRPGFGPSPSERPEGRR
jgi:hypothetical protein